MTTTTKTMTETVRLRVEFKDRHMLTKSQRTTEGLRRTWILLKPHHRTVADLAVYLLRAFHLHRSCPDGLLISMDGFVLPPFESTSIFRDKDIISVKRKGGTLSGIGMLDDGTNSIEVEEMVERQQPLNTGMKLLANQEFEKETGGYESESEEDEPYQLEDPLPVENAHDSDTKRRSKKRKLSDKPESSKRKRSKTASMEDLQNGVGAEKNESSHQSRVVLRTSCSKKEKSIAGEGEVDNSGATGTDKRTSNISKSTPNGKRSCQLQESEVKGVVSTDMPSGSKKLPSRSARRKKAKRQWLREKMKAEKEQCSNLQLHQCQLLKTDNRQSSGKDNQRCPQEHQQLKTGNGEDDEQSNTDNDEEDEQLKLDNNKAGERQDTDNDEDNDVVPVVIRPGHIRFGPPRKGDQPIQQDRTAVGPWNGITSKKKGQKWGMDKTPHIRPSDYKDLNQDSPEKPVVEKEIPVNDLIDFNKLELCTTVPKEGDQIAYRLIELSSCWTPEVSSYRVGKVSWYDPQSNKVMLVQVPEYPIVFEDEETDEASDAEPHTSLYGEDGSLEVDYSSLIDVRIVKHGNLKTAKVVAGDQNGASGLKHGNLNAAKAVTGDQNAASGFRQLNNDKEPRVATQENGKANPWDEISQALNAKKAQLSQEDGWGKNDGSVKSSWSYRGLRGSALGPTVARLRAQSEL